MATTVWEIEVNQSDEWTTQSVAESVWQIETTPGVPTIFLNSNSDIVKWANNTGNITAWVSTSAPFWVIS